VKGYIKDYRQELESDIWLMPPLYHRVWQYLKYMVNHKDKEIPMRDGSSMTIEAGQHLTAVRDIAENIGYYERGRWKKPNPKTVSDILDWLQKKDMISIERGKGNRQYTLIKLLNWEVYQMKDNESNSTETESKHQTDINKNDKNDENDKKKQRDKRLVFDDKQMMLAELLWKYVQINVPSMKQPNINSWANTIRLMMERDDRQGKDIQEIILWSTQHDFWCENILSADKLRKQFDKLKVQMEQEHKKVTKINQFKGGSKPYEAYQPSDGTKYEYGF
jgi:hypothetical protein